MPIPLRPKDIEIPEDDPFKNDLLDRKKTAQVLTEVVQSFSGPGVVALDAPWGVGKTTFLKMWKRHLRTSRFAVIEFNAWKTDFAEDPFLALSTELHSAIVSSGIDVPRKLMHRIKETTQEVVKHGVRELVRLTASSVPVVGGVAGTVADSALASFAEARVSSYTKRKDAVRSFQQSLCQVARTVAEKADEKPIVVIIDELDRCRPTYAVEFLEVAKHVFSVNNVVFVLGINRKQLAHSIRALYGHDFDADVYLRRFIDASIHLPESDRRALVNAAIKNSGILDWADRRQAAGRSDHLESVRSTLLNILCISDVDARTTLSSIHLLGLVLQSVPMLHRSVLSMSALATLLIAHDANIYRRLCRGMVSDTEAIEAVQNHCLRTDWINTYETRYFEEYVIRIVKDQFERGEAGARLRRLGEYEAMLATHGDNARTTEEQQRAQDIVGYVERGGAQGEGGPRARISTDFALVAARFDLLSGSAPFE